MSELKGRGRAKFCEECQTPVYAFDAYSRTEQEQLWNESGGHLCGILCEEAAPESRSRRAVLVGALLTAISPLVAQTGRIRIRVTDPASAIVPGADVALLDREGQPTTTTKSNSEGEAAFSGLPMGDSTFTISSIGFKKRTITLTVSSADVVVTEVALPVGEVTMGTFVTAEPLLVGSVRLIVRAAAGVFIDKADVEFPGIYGKATGVRKTDHAGETVFENLPQGRIQFIVRAPGYASQTVTVQIKTTEETKFFVTLEKNPVIFIAVATGPLHHREACERVWQHRGNMACHAAYGLFPGTQKRKQLEKCDPSRSRANRTSPKATASSTEWAIASSSSGQLELMVLDNSRAVLR